VSNYNNHNQSITDSQQYFEKVHQVEEIVAANSDLLLNEFELPSFRGSKVTCPCPLHYGADNPRGFVMYDSGYWKCNTHLCESIFGKKSVGLVRGLLSKREGWKSAGDKIVSYNTAVRYLCRLYNININNIKIDFTLLEKTKFSNTNWNCSREDSILIPRSYVEQSLEIPCEYALKRGFSAEILKRYGVGLCKNSKKEMAGRVVVPMLDESGKYIVGCSGRTLKPECPKCKRFHDGICPNYESVAFAKWRHSKFESGNYLYNYWEAKPVIKQTGKVYLTEGPFDCLRLVESGYVNSIAVFGGNISEFHEILLEKAGCGNIVCLFDNDDAGLVFREVLKKKLCGMYRLSFPDLPADKKDVGECSVEEIRKLLG